MNNTKFYGLWVSICIAITALFHLSLMSKCEDPEYWYLYLLCSMFIGLYFSAWIMFFVELSVHISNKPKNE